MANQKINVSTNHDVLTGRLAGEDVAIRYGSVLTIDSMPQHTAMGILGDLNFSTGGGEIHIDGRYVREITYSSGSGTLPAVGAAVSWNSSAGTGKIIRRNSGNNAAGTMTITRQSGANPTGTITSGGWSATVATDRQGLLMVFGEDQIWDAVDATCTLRITGDWYEIGTGTGLDNQSITLPHSGMQHAIWVETGNGTGVYEIWHRVYNGNNSTVFFDQLADWGNTFETGFVFAHTPGTSTLTFGTSTAGGAPPSGAKIRIPNVHIGTTTVGAPLVEVTGLTLASYLEIIDSAVTENVLIDHLNASSCYFSLIQTNGATITDSVIGLWHATNVINKCNKEVYIENCAFICGVGLAGSLPYGNFTIHDNTGGITFVDCVIHAAVNGSTSGVLNLANMANLTMQGRNKLVNNQQDEDLVGALRGSVASNIDIDGDLIVLNAGVSLLAGCVNWDIENIIWSQLTARSTTDDIHVLLSLVGCDGVRVHGGRFAVGSGVRHMHSILINTNDAANVHIRNFGAIDNKIDCGGRGTTVVTSQGISTNCSFKRLWFTNRNTAIPFQTYNAAANITIENCSCDYNDELEPNANRMLAKGIHGASGNIGTATGVEDDYVNVLASIFYDVFKSNTTGGIGLLFNDRGQKHLNDVTINAGSPIWNGIGDLLMLTVGDQVTYEWPYTILGHTGFDNIRPHLLGVNCGTLGSSWGNFNVEYALDTGSGYGSWKQALQANLTAETISPAGFKLKVRLTCLTASLTNSIRGFQIHTTTTIADQKANLYPLDVNTVTFTGLPTGCDAVVLVSGTGTILDQKDQLAGTSYVYTYSGAQTIDIGFIKPGYVPYYIRNLALTTVNASIPVSLTADRNYQ